VKKKLTMVVGAILMVGVLSSCGYSLPSDLVAVHVQKGPFQAKKVVGCEDASTRKVWTNDDYVKFPTSEREWDATGQSGSDSKAFSSVTKDSVEMSIPVTIRFTLKTDCKTLKDFYNRYARRYDAHFNDSNSYTDGWETLLRKLVADPADQTLDRIVQGYNWRDVWQNPQVKTDLEKQLNEALQSDSSLMVQTAKAQYFEGISVLIGSPQPKNAELKTAVAQEQTSVAKAQSEEAQAKADAAKAQAQIAVSQAEAAKKRAEIDGFKSEDDYLKWFAIQNGQNPFQPTYIVSGTKP